MYATHPRGTVYQRATKEKSPNKRHALVPAAEAWMFLHGQRMARAPARSIVARTEGESIDRTTRGWLRRQATKRRRPGLSAEASGKGARSAGGRGKQKRAGTSKAGGSGAKKPQRVLIADDNERIRRELRVVIESHTPCQVCGEAVDGVEAMEKTIQLEPDLLIVDLTMPRMNGLEVAAKLRSKKYARPIMLFTVHADSFPAENAAELSLTVVSKAMDVLLLADEIKKLVSA